VSGLFTAKRPDGKSEWRVVYELAVLLSPGDVLLHEQIRTALDIPDESGMERVYKAASRAAKELRRHNQRSLESVPGLGYRMLLANEHELQSRRYQRSSRRRMQTSLEVVKATNTEELTPAERQKTMALQMVLQGMCQVISDLDVRQRRTEAALSRIEVQTEERLSEQEQQMARMAEAMREAGILKA
jgi:hypothetical protein